MILFFAGVVAGVFVGIAGVLLLIDGALCRIDPVDEDAAQEGGR